MNKRFRISSAPLLLTAIASGAFLLAAPASADPGHRAHPRHHPQHARAHYPPQHARGFAVYAGRHDDGCASVRSYRRGYRLIARAARHAYYCGLCRHGYASRARFDHHLHRHHHVPVWQIPGVVIQTSIGWVFDG